MIRNLTVLMVVVAVLAFAVSAAAQPTPVPSSMCPDGRSITDDTKGHCCWDGQAWNGTRCVGVPTSCPANFAVDATHEICAVTPCATGQVRGDGAHCCWPGQAWAASRAACIGIPTSCPDFYRFTADGCVPPADQDLQEARCRTKKDGNACYQIALTFTLDSPKRSEYLNLGCKQSSQKACDQLKSDQSAIAAVAASDAAAAAAAAQKAEADKKAADAAAEQKRVADEQAKAQAEQDRAKAEEEARRQQARKDAEAKEAQRRQAEEEAKQRQDALDRARGRRKAGYIIGGIGLGIGAVSFVFMGLGAAENSSIQGGGLSSGQAIASAASTGQTYNTLAWVCGVTGIVGLGIGGALVLFNPDPESSASVGSIDGGLGFRFARRW
jgi:hypothetical protein